MDAAAHAHSHDPAPSRWPIITSPGRYAVPPPPGRGAAQAGPAPSSDVDLMVEEVKAAAQDGVSCIVDGGHPDMGRKLENLKQIAQRTSVHIVASGGYYMDRSYPPEIATKLELRDPLLVADFRARIDDFSSL